MQMKKGKIPTISNDGVFVIFISYAHFSSAVNLNLTNGFSVNLFCAVRFGDLFSYHIHLFGLILLKWKAKCGKLPGVNESTNNLFEYLLGRLFKKGLRLIKWNWMDGKLPEANGESPIHMH
jgi:hypothetical protein